MSDLKHQSPEELRRRIKATELYRQKLQAQWEKAEAEVERLQEESRHARQKYHNMGQRLVWARKYLAEKEIQNA